MASQPPGKDENSSDRFDHHQSARQQQTHHQQHASSQRGSADVGSPPPATGFRTVPPHLRNRRAPTEQTNSQVPNASTCQSGGRPVAAQGRGLAESEHADPDFIPSARNTFAASHRHSPSQQATQYQGQGPAQAEEQLTFNSFTGQPNPPHVPGRSFAAGPRRGWDGTGSLARGQVHNPFISEFQPGAGAFPTRGQSGFNSMSGYNSQTSGWDGANMERQGARERDGSRSEDAGSYSKKPVGGGYGGYGRMNSGGGDGGDGRRSSGAPKRQRTCYTCGELGHLSKECPNARGPSGDPPASTQEPPFLNATANTFAPTIRAPSSTVQGPRTTVITIDSQELSPDQLILTSKVHNLGDKKASKATDILGHMLDCGLRTEFGNEGTSREVVTNYFKISQRPAFLFVYKLTFIRRWVAGDDGEDKPIYVKNKVERQALFEQFRSRRELSRLIGEVFWVTDYDMIWSSHALFEGEEFEIRDIHATDLSATNPTTAKTINVSDAWLQFDRVIDLGKTMGQLFRYSTGHTKGNDDTAVLSRGLNAIVTLNAHSKCRKDSSLMAVGANTFYGSKDPSRLSRTMSVLKGVAASVRPGAQSLLLNVSPKFSPFLNPMNLHDFVKERRWPGRFALLATLKGVQVEISVEVAPKMSRQERRRVITGLGEPIETQELNDAQKSNGINTVLQYFWNWLAVNGQVSADIRKGFAINVGGKPRKKGDGKKKEINQEDPEWYPARCLRIADYAPYHEKLTPSQTTSMINVALQPPNNHLNNIKFQASNMIGIGGAAFQADLPNHFAMQVESVPFRVTGRILKPPNISYQNKNLKSAQINRASWDLRAVQLKVPCQTSIVLIVDLTALRIANRNDDDATSDSSSSTVQRSTLGPRFAATLQGSMRNLGLTSDIVKGPFSPENVTEDTQIDEARLEKIITDMIATHASLTDRRDMTIMIAMPAKDYDLYARIKRVAELKMGWKTVCFDASKVYGFGNPDGRGGVKGAQHCANIALKLNLKGESDNHHISKDNLKPLYNEGTIDPKNGNSGIANTIVVGADVTHPMGNCAPGCPSIAAVVGSTDDHFAHFPGSMRLQRSRQEVITELPDMLKERLIDWANRHNGKLPTSMLFYRDGVSESQYEEVRGSEITAVREAFVLAAHYLENRGPDSVQQDKESEGSSCPSFKLTFVIVGKRHNTRFYAETQRAPTPDDVVPPPSYENVEPGCVVDQGITHPYLFDFYLQSHQAIRGTARSAHYVVLQNNMNLSADELQNITHSLCFNYARATKGVSYCGPAYYADRLCDRGRVYIRGWLADGDTYHAERSRGKNETVEQFNDYVRDFLYQHPDYRAHQGHPPIYGQPRRNPWMPSLDNTMFYL